jgi:hypothetical protein
MTRDEILNMPAGSILDDLVETNKGIQLTLELLNYIVQSNAGGLCCADYGRTGFRCNRTEGHKGLHVAVGSRVCAVWDDCVGK